MFILDWLCLHVPPIKSNPLYLEFKNKAMKIPVVNSSSPIKILAESVKGFMSYDPT